MKQFFTLPDYFNKTLLFNKLNKIHMKAIEKTHNMFQNQISAIITHCRKSTPIVQFCIRSIDLYI